MLAEAMIATRGFMSKQFAGKFSGTGSKGTSSGGNGFMRGGLAGVVNRSFTNSAIKKHPATAAAVLVGKPILRLSVKEEVLLIPSLEK